jgi:alanyl aminopeptidase
LALVIFVCVACSAPERPTMHAPASPGLRLPEGVEPIRYDLRLELDPEKPTFTGHVDIAIRITKPVNAIWIHADKLTIASATLDGRALPEPSVGDQMLGYRMVLDPGTATLAFDFTGSLEHDEEGLFRQESGGANYIFSQGESVFARRFTPCFDEPRFKTPWQLTLVVPKANVALANTAELSSRTLDDGRKEVKFADSAPLPSYLVALAVGPFDLVDAGKVGKVPVRVAIHKGGRKQVPVVAAKLPAIVSAMEAYVGGPLPLDKLDIVAVPHLFGAMENPGLITFDEPILTAELDDKEATDNFVLVAAHEIAHQWFGNSVTPAWWDDLWLSEGFASWLGNKVEQELGAVDDVPLRLALTRREAIAADDGIYAAPLRRAVLHNEDPDDSFDEIAYQKGHVVLSTFEAYLGAERFRNILRAYLAAHRGGTATTSDMVAEVAKATDAATARSFEQYVRKSGVPVVDFTVDCAAKKVIAHARDGRDVPVCTRDACALVGERTELTATCPVLGNARGGYYHSAGLPLDVPHLDERARIIAGDDIAAAVMRGEVTAKDALAQLETLADSHDPYAQLGAVAIARVLDRFVDDRQRPAWSAWIGARFSDRLISAHKQAVETELARAVIDIVPAEQFPAMARRAALETVQKIVEDGKRELPEEIVRLAAPQGGDKLFARIAARAKGVDADLRDNYYEALGEFGPAQTRAAAQLFVSAPAAWPAVEAFFARPATAHAMWQALQPKLALVLEHVAADELVDVTATLCDKTSRDQVAAGFKGTRRDRALAATLASIDRCVAARAKAGELQLPR